MRRICCSLPFLRGGLGRGRRVAGFIGQVPAHLFLVWDLLGARWVFHRKGMLTTGFF